MSKTDQILTALIEKEIRKGRKEVRIPAALFSEASQIAVQEVRRLCKLNNLIIKETK